MERLLFFRRLSMVVFLVGAVINVNAQSEKTSDDWLMVTDTGILIEMNMVGCIVSADTNDTFCVIGNNGSLLADRVKKATFAAPGTMVVGIKAIDNAIEPQMISYVVADRLTVMNAKAGSTVYSIDGKAVARADAKDGTAVFNVSNLPQGIYIVRTGKQSFKFFKK